MGSERSTWPDHYIEAFVRFACQHLAVESWEELEPTLSASWVDLVGPDVPPWSEVGPTIRERCETSAVPEVPGHFSP